MRSMTRIPGRPAGGASAGAVAAAGADPGAAEGADLGPTTAEPSPAFAVRRVGDPVGARGVPEAAATPDAWAAPAGSPSRPDPSASATSADTAHRPRRWLVGLLGLVAALGLAGTVGFALAWSNANAATSAQNAAASSARSLVVALTNFDPGTVRADFSRIQSMSTGSFASQAKHFFGSSIGRQLSAAGAASRGRVVALDVQSVNGSHATVFAVVSQSYLNDKVKTPIDDTLRLVLGLTDTNGSWLVSSVQVVQQPVG